VAAAIQALRSDAATPTMETLPNATRRMPARSATRMTEPSGHATHTVVPAAARRHRNDSRPSRRVAVTRRVRASMRESVAVEPSRTQTVVALAAIEIGAGGVEPDPPAIGTTSVTRAVR